MHTYVYSLVQVGLYPFTLPTNILLLNRVSDSISKVDASLFNIIHITDTLEYCNKFDVFIEITMSKLVYNKKSRTKKVFLLHF